jgi:hypothetical protein
MLIAVLEALRHPKTDFTLQHGSLHFSPLRLLRLLTQRQYRLRMMKGRAAGQNNMLNHRKFLLKRVSVFLAIAATSLSKIKDKGTKR